MPVIGKLLGMGPLPRRLQAKVPEVRMRLQSRRRKRMRQNAHSSLSAVHSGCFYTVERSIAGSVWKLAQLANVDHAGRIPMTLRKSSWCQNLNKT